MSLDRTTLIEQLARSLARLELEFRELGDDDARVPDLGTMAEKIDFAAYCIVAAKRARAGGRALHFADDAHGA